MFDPGLDPQDVVLDVDIDVRLGDAGDFHDDG
jgi:hypothetical protein